MSENLTLKGYLGDEFQLKCIWQILTESEFAQDTIPLLEISYFDDATYKRLYSIIKQYTKEYDIPPNLQNGSIYTAIKKFHKKNNTTEVELLETVVNNIKNWNNRILNKELPHDGEVIQKEMFNFIKQQEWKKISDFIQNGIKNGDNSSEFLFEIEEKVKKVGEIGDDDDMGIEVMDNFSRALEKNFRKAIPTGIKGIDELTKGGLGNGEMGIILAASGVGKSTILSYIANTAYNHGYNVLQIIFEDNVDDIRRKHFCKWTKIPLSDIDDNRELVTQKLVEWHNKNDHGRLYIKKFSQEDTTIPKIRQYMDKYKKKHGITFDILVLDYIDCLESHKRGVDQNANELTIIKSFEAMADDYNIPCWTAIQANRCLDLNTIVDIKKKGKIKIKDVNVGDLINTHEGYKHITHKFPIEKQKRFKIKLKSGKEIICSNRHEFPTSTNELLSINNGLSVGNKLLTK